MPNKNYRKGTDYERLLVKAAVSQGNLALRSAGSKGFADVVVIDIWNNTIKFIQCKTGQYSNLEKARLEEQYKPLNNTYKVTFEVMSKDGVT